MKGRLTQDVRRRALEMLRDGINRHSIANALGISPAQVSAIAAHRTMGTYDELLSGDPSAATDDERSQRASDYLEGVGYLRVVEPVAYDTSVPLGTDIDSNASVFWQPRQAANPHVLVLGESGFGKTYAASCLVAELAQQQIPSLIFDYGQGFSLAHSHQSFRRLALPVELHLNKDGIGINPLEIFPVDLHGPATVAQRVADTLARVYPGLGIQQHSLLRRAVVDVFAASGIEASDPTTWGRMLPPFKALDDQLHRYTAQADLGTRRAASTVASHISTLFFFDIFRATATHLRWTDLLGRGGRSWILQLGDLERSVERAVTEFLLWNLIRFFEVAGPGSLRCFVVLDEAHRLSFGSGSPVEKILREGRKFGLGLILASQQPEDFSSVAFANTATKIVFQVGDDHGMVSRRLHKKALNSSSAEQVASVITKLPRGCAYIMTSNRGRIVKMFSFEDRLRALDSPQ